MAGRSQVLDPHVRGVDTPGRRAGNFPAIVVTESERHTLGLCSRDSYAAFTRDFAVLNAFLLWRLAQAAI